MEEVLRAATEPRAHDRLNEHVAGGDALLLVNRLSCHPHDMWEHSPREGPRGRRHERQGEVQAVQRCSVAGAPSLLVEVQAVEAAQAVQR